jgi:hypothetical protein
MPMTKRRDVVGVVEELLLNELPDVRGKFVEGVEVDFEARRARPTGLAISLSCLIVYSTSLPFSATHCFRKKTGMK